jgi:hypothetical protein
VAELAATDVRLRLRGALGGPALTKRVRDTVDAFVAGFVLPYQAVKIFDVLLEMFARVVS